MKPGLRFGGVLCWLLLSASWAWPQQAIRLQQSLTAIAKGANSAERAKAITARLDAAGVHYQLEDFVDRRMRRGTNIVVTLSGGETRTVLLGAHYDRVAIGQGVLDNGASCAVLLELIEAFKASPLRNTTLIFVFFDLEEGGLSGSQAYFASRRTLPDFALNLDVFGYGDTFFVAASKPSGALAASLNTAAGSIPIPVETISPAQYPDSDHLNMIRAGVETIGLSLLPGDEIEGVIAAIGGRAVTRIPPVLATIHTERDNLQVIRVADIAKAIPALERMMRLVDAR